MWCIESAVRQYLVQQQNSRLAYHGSRNGDSLPLSPGQLRALFADHSGVAERELGDEAVRIGQGCSGNHIVDRGSFADRLGARVEGRKADRTVGERERGREKQEEKKTDQNMYNLSGCKQHCAARYTAFCIAYLW